MFSRRSTADEVRELALMALASALQEQVKSKQRRKPRLGGVGALATGAVLYTAGRVVAPRLREQLEAQQSSRDGDERQDDEESTEDAPVAEDEQSYDEDENDEPQAEGDDESYDEDEHDEPQAEGDDESYDDDEYEEPQAEDESYDEEERRPAKRPRRSRSPVGRT